MTTVRMLAPASPAALQPVRSKTVEFPSNGGSPRSQSSTPGQVIDASIFDADRLALAGGWSKIALSGPTASRPATAPQGNTNSWQDPAFVAGPGFHYFDTDLNQIVVSDGSVFRDPATGNAV